jgi:dihydrodipicolinate synthase/N-acetylneuraminate lyase
LGSQGLAGIYTTSSSGEVFALRIEEHHRLTAAVLEEAGHHGVPVQIGCAGAGAGVIVEQAEFAAERDAAAIQVMLPYGGRLTWDETVRFFEDLARACGATPLVHYNSRHAGTKLEPDDYRRLKDRVPTLIGTKLPGADPVWFATVCQTASDLSHFTGEYSLAADFAAGARGMYSWLAVTNPRLAVRWVEACRRGNWNEAMRIQRLVIAYKVHVKRYWRGTSEAAINKADAMLNPNLRCGLAVRPPYTPCSAQDLEAARIWAERHFPELMEGIEV